MTASERNVMTASVPSMRTEQVTSVTSKKQRTSPNPLQWLGYSVGRKLPDSMQDWVRNDLIGDWAVPRHLIPKHGAVHSSVRGLHALPRTVGPGGHRWCCSECFWHCSIRSPTWLRTGRARLERHGLPSDLENPKKISRHDAEKGRLREVARRPRDVDTSVTCRGGRCRRSTRRRVAPRSPRSPLPARSNEEPIRRLARPDIR